MIDLVSVEELDWSAESQVLIPAEHLWCDCKYRPWAKNSSPNTKWISEDLSKCLKCSIPASPLVCLLGDLDGVTTEDNTIHMAFTALCIAKKTVLMNWKNKNNLNINQYRDYLWDYISLETASADTLDQSLWAPLISSIT